MNKTVLYSLSMLSFSLLSSIQTTVGMEYVKSYWSNSLNAGRSMYSGVSSTVNTCKKAYSTLAGNAESPALLRAQAAQNRLLLNPTHIRSLNEALDIAVRHNNTQAVIGQLQRGALVNNNDFAPVLLTAIAHPRADIDLLQALIDFGANFDVQNEQGQTPLMIAIQYNKGINAIRTFVEAGANLEMRDTRNQTALMYVAHFMPRTNRDEREVAINTAELLINNGARIPGNNPRTIREYIQHTFNKYAGTIGVTGIGLSLLILMCKSYAITNPLFWACLVIGGLGTKVKINQITDNIMTLGTIFKGVPLFGPIVNRLVRTEANEHREQRILETLQRIQQEFPRPRIF